uniref:Uncharacterized protein n=1 Tax=viral metagenome TaxID=1070528 RepID=A0A6C0EKK5_9ZZZZ
MVQDTLSNIKGFTKITNTIKTKFIIIKKTHDINIKTSIAESIFKLLSYGDGRILLDLSVDLNSSVRLKLVELYFKQEIKAAYKWYRDIFNERMPCESY